MHYSTMSVPSQLGEQLQEEYRQRSLYEHFQRVTDHRCLRGRRYEAALVLTLLVLAKLAGESKISGIAHWVRLRGGWLVEQLLLKHQRLPCVNTYRYVLAHVDEEELEREIVAFMVALCASEECVGEEAKAALTQVVMDGKVLRGTDRQGEVVQAPMMVVGAYHVLGRYILGQNGVSGRGQEKQAARQLLARLDLAGRVLSADALYTSASWCRQVRQQGGDYLLIVKGNRPELYEDIASLFAEGPYPDLPEQHSQTVNKGHGRLEIRRLRISSALSDYLKPGWPDVAQVFQIERRINRPRHTTLEYSYGLTSLPADRASPAQVLRLVRQHWHIENILHWRRDVTLGEDACLVSQGSTPRLLALINNVVLSLIDHAGGQHNAAAKIREFAAFPQSALDLLLQPP